MPRPARPKATDSAHAGQLIDLHQALTNQPTGAITPTPTASHDYYPPPLTRPYRFEDLGWKPLVNYIPTPKTPPAPLTDPDLGWLD